MHEIKCAAIIIYWGKAKYKCLTPENTNGILSNDFNPQILEKITYKQLKITQS
jgi:hypothetical protein